MKRVLLVILSILITAAFLTGCINMASESYIIAYIYRWILITQENKPSDLGSYRDYNSLSQIRL